MAHTFWRGEHIVYPHCDGTADVYAWDAAASCYRWEADFNSSDAADRHVREMEALPEFPEIKPITTLPKLQDVFDRAWTKQQARKAS